MEETVIICSRYHMYVGETGLMGTSSDLNHDEKADCIPASEKIILQVFQHERNSS
jgi:hypothetical protein